MAQTAFQANEDRARAWQYFFVTFATLIAALLSTQVEGIDRRQLYLPLVVENEVIGTVGLDVVEEGIELTEDQLRLAETIVYQAATAVQRARLFNETEQARRDAERLYALSAALNAAQDLDAILGAVVASDLAEGASGAALSIIDTDDEGTPAWAALNASTRCPRRS